MWSPSWDARASRSCLNKNLQHLGLGRLMSRSRLFASRAQDVILPKGVYAWSRLHVIAPYKLILCIIILIITIIIIGRENRVTTAIIITCRPRPILVSRWCLVTYKSLISVLSLYLNVSVLFRLVRPTSQHGLGLISVSGLQRLESIPGWMAFYKMHQTIYYSGCFFIIYIVIRAFSSWRLHLTNADFTQLRHMHGSGCSSVTSVTMVQGAF